MSLGYILPRAPLLLAQGLWVRHRALRLPEPAGPRHGHCGSGPPLRLLIAGDSSAAGVGVAHQDQALAGRLAAHLAPHLQLDWQLCARNGETAASLPRLLAELPVQNRDVALIVLGVNDAKGGVSRAAWRRNYAALLDNVQARFGALRIIVMAVPPLGRFPLLPQPLRNALGLRAAALDETLRQLVTERTDVTYLPHTQPPDPALLARDGFHPGAVLYDAWAEQIARTILAK